MNKFLEIYENFNRKNEIIEENLNDFKVISKEFFEIKKGSYFISNCEILKEEFIKFMNLTLKSFYLN